MHRFFLPPEACTETALTLDGREAHHALHVLRLRQGDAVEILDGQGSRYRCHVSHGEKRRLHLTVEDKATSPAPPWHITLCVAVTKPKALEWTVQKAAELGAARVVPILTERVTIKTGPDRFNLDKWKWVAVDAIKQCGSPWLPLVETPRPPAHEIEAGEPYDLSWVASLASSTHPRRTLESFAREHGRAPRRLAVWIGPEGDFTAEELTTLQAAGARAVSLGPLVLRAETAAIYCLSILNHELRYLEETLE